MGTTAGFDDTTFGGLGMGDYRQGPAQKGIWERIAVDIAPRQGARTSERVLALVGFSVPHL